MTIRFHLEVDDEAIGSLPLKVLQMPNALIPQRAPTVRAITDLVHYRNQPSRVSTSVQ